MEKKELKRKLKDIRDQLTEKNEKEYLNEVIKTLEADCRRSSIVMGWGILIHFLYHKMAEYGLDSCGKIAKEKNWLKGNLNNPYDFNKISESNTLTLAREIGLLSPQLESQLSIQLKKRNNCAHIGKYVPSENSMLEFYDEIIQGINTIQEKDFEERETKFLKQILKLDENKIKKKKKKGRKIVNAVKRIEGKLKFVEKRSEFEKYQNYYLYLKYLSKESRDQDVLDTIIDIYLSLLRYDTPSTGQLEDLGMNLTKTNRFRERAEQNPDLVEPIIRTFSKSWSYRTAEERMELLFTVEKFLNEEQINRIAEATIQNEQIHQAYDCRDKLSRFIKNKKEAISDGVWEDLKEIGFL